MKLGAKIVVMLHPDYQYDPTLLPQMIEPIRDDQADVVLGSQLMGNSPVQQGMPWWKFAGNRFLTTPENWTFGLELSEYHTGCRAYRRRALESVNFEMNSDSFAFDQEIIAQFVQLDHRPVEIPVPTRTPVARSRGKVFRPGSDRPTQSRETLTESHKLSVGGAGHPFRNEHGLWRRRGVGTTWGAMAFSRRWGALCIGSLRGAPAGHPPAAR